tara:strand:- start:98 stop:325 length:228 start_codon:yes stop_codon:yes gene_type:complete
MIELFEVSYENNEGILSKRYKNIDDITLDFGLNKREIMSFYSSMKTPKIDCVVKSITKVTIEEEKEQSNIVVVFE